MFSVGFIVPLEIVRVDFAFMTGTRRVLVIKMFLHSIEPGTIGMRDVVRVVTPEVNLVVSRYSFDVNPWIPDLTKSSMVEYQRSVSGSPNWRSSSVEKRY